MIHSPKNKFRAEVNYDSPLKGIGSVTSLSSDDLNELKSLIHNTMQGKTKACIIIKENKKQYPEFDWVQIERYYGNVTPEMNQRLCLADKIISLRLQKGMTQEDLAQKVNMSYQAISRIERGLVSVGYDILAKIAIALECKIDIVKI